MKRHIIIHWTAGLNEPSYLEKKHYHFLIDSEGNIHNGEHSIEDNDATSDGDYAAHCGGGNTMAIGNAVCGMAGYQSPQIIGKYPLTKIQCERLFELCAKQLIAEGWNEAIELNCLTHYEFGKLHPETSSAGKIDITYLPPYPEIHADMVGDFIRGKVNWYIQKLRK